MKAVLEFNYPDDEEKLRCALQGEVSMAALRKIHGMVKLEYSKTDFKQMVLTLFEIQRIADRAIVGQGDHDD